MAGIIAPYGQTPVEVILDGATGRVLPAEANNGDLTSSPPPLPPDLRTLDGEPVELRASVRTAANVAQFQ